MKRFLSYLFLLFCMGLLIARFAMAQEVVGGGEVEVSFGQYGLPVILTMIMGIFYKYVNVPDKWRALLTIGIGIVLGLVGLAYAGMSWEVKHIVDYSLYGLMQGASAVGLYEGVYRTAARPRS